MKIKYKLLNIVIYIRLRKFSYVFAIFSAKPIIAQYLLLENAAVTKQIHYICR